MTCIRPESNENRLKRTWHSHKPNGDVMICQLLSQFDVSYSHVTAASEKKKKREKNKEKIFSIFSTLTF